MTKFEKMIADLDQIREELKPEYNKAQQIDSDLAEDLDGADEFLRRAVASIKSARKHIKDLKRQSSQLEKAFPDEKYKEEA
jgi:prefoldin subunit 5